MMAEYHKPVLLNEALSFLNVHPGGVYVDCTLGGGGHAKEILAMSSPDGVLIGIDRDDEAIGEAGRVLREYGDRARLVRGDFRELGKILAEAGERRVDGVLFDFGVSSHQLEAGERGFSLAQDAPLDMRMDRGQRLTAGDLVNSLTAEELTDLIRRYSDERWAKRIALRIVEERRVRRIETTRQLAEIVAGAIPKGAWPPGIHPATRTFQALRIVVNAEIDAVEQGLQQAVGALKPGGRVVAVSYHSGEDRVVKTVFRLMGGQCECPPSLPICVCGARKTVEVLTKKPVKPSAEEIDRNLRARSAKLRAAEKVIEDD